MVRAERWKPGDGEERGFGGFAVRRVWLTSQPAATKHVIEEACLIPIVVGDQVGDRDPNQVLDLSSHAGFFGNLSNCCAGRMLPRVNDS